jgi:hypothetical protein
MKLSAAITALQQLLSREGDIDLTAEGFFGEVCSAKFHLKNRAGKRNAYFSPTLDGAKKGARVVMVSHS